MRCFFILRTGRKGVESQLGGHGTVIVNFIFSKWDNIMEFIECFNYKMALCFVLSLRYFTFL